MDLDDKLIKSEIEELHQFFEDWFNGNISKDKIKLMENALSRQFSIINPDGKILNRTQIIKTVNNNYNTTKDWKIWVENITTKFAGNVIIATYYELQENQSKRTKRLSTAIFTQNQNAKNLCSWNHVHETWVKT